MRRLGGPGRGALLVLAVLALACGSRPEPATLVLRNGAIATLDPAAPRAEALAARGDRIVAVGTEREIARYVGEETETIDLGGRFATPGFIDSHLHVLGLGRARLTLDVTGARTWDEVVAQAAARARGLPAGTWILGWGWHQEKWARAPEPSVEGAPVHDALSRAVPDHPVVLKHAAGGHGGMANARALEIAGIGRGTPDPPGGRIVRDAAGRPTGFLRENALDLVLAAQARDEARSGSRDEVRRRELAVALEECASKGLTTVHDAHATFEEIDLFRRVAEEGTLPVRLWVMVLDTPEALRARLRAHRWIGVGDDHLTVRAVKQQVDGALGSHGAWLLAPYADHPGTGLNTTPLEQVEEVARLAREEGFQLAVHAIGDRANREVLDLFERVGSPELRWRIEHAQHLDPADVPRFARLGVIAAMQGIHCTSDGPWVPRRIGEERARAGAYAWRALLDAGARICNGTDAPIEDPDPVASFAASVTRRLPDGGAFHPGQRMTREEALRSYTVEGAYAGFEEDLKGTLAPGKLADVTVWSQDLLAVPDSRIRDTKAVLTIVGGEVVHRAP